MLPIIIVSIIIVLLISMFLKGYFYSKKEAKKKEVNFRSELLAIIDSNSLLTEDIATYIMNLPLKRLSIFLEEHTLIHQDTLIQLQKKHFE
ncbi:hypothetical protein [Paenibacillus terrae]|uniref:Uncharacterized protein n=1 Tax=Paenibacillus terrae TaxID=159743 RepID=A0A0D7WUT8_9BACL|nr:hypothetical protein [Paenibacillus terrae]KJD42951.1 hypothetical protein QD47_25370 [Paenibacillus terrae]